MKSDVSDSPRSTTRGYSAMHRKRLTIVNFPAMPGGEQAGKL